jgi:hypothetical protein
MTETGEENADFGRPSVLIVRNVARLTGPQQEAVGRFLADGGGVLVTLGDRVDADYYNVQLYRGGKGWLPAHLDGVEGDGARADKAAHPAPGGSDHPALRVFLDKPKDGRGEGRFPQLSKASFPRWWKLSTPGSNAAGVQAASLSSRAAEYPFLVEWIDPNRAGRVLLCAVPLDDSWGTNVVKIEAFVPLVHELVYYLAGTRSAEFNLEPGQPLRHRLDSLGSVESFTLQTPQGDTKPLTTNPADKDAILAAVDRLPQGAVLRIDGVRETGVYKLKTTEGGTINFVVRPKNAEESDLTPCSEDDRARVAGLIPGLKYQNDRESGTVEWVGEDQRQELWQWLLLGLIAFLCGEVWMTRRMVRNR